MSRRMWAGAVAAWVAVVIAGSGVTWIAIERAGDQVTATPESPETTRPPVIGTVGPAPSVGPATPSGKPARPTTPTSSPPATPTTRPTTSAPVVTSAPKPSSQPVVRTEVRTWSGAPGSLTVACTGSEVSFRSATPSDGWSFERGDSSGEEIEVTFKSGAGEVQVRATCSGGVPQFRVESDRDGE